MAAEDQQRQSVRTQGCPVPSAEPIDELLDERVAIIDQRLRSDVVAPRAKVISKSPSPPTA
jgi:hypothetical protein